MAGFKLGFNDNPDSIYRLDGTKEAERDRVGRFKSLAVLTRMTADV